VGSTVALTCARVSSRSEIEALLPEWRELFESSGAPNPFAHPLWVTTWLRHYARPGDVYIVTLRRGDELVAVAPFYRRARFAEPLASACLQLAGSGASDRLTEIPQVLVGGHPVRKALREIVRFLLVDCHGDWDWLELALTREQGWFEPAWIPSEPRCGEAFFVHKATRPFVVLPLPASWDELRGGFKRNVKESMRRGTNRAAHAQLRRVLVRPTEDDELPAAIDEVLRLHRLRAGLLGHERHADYFERPPDERFMRSATAALFREGLAWPIVLLVDDSPAAGRLVLRGNRSVFLSFSGIDPAWWDLSAGTTLTGEVLKAAIGRGDSVANLSLHPEEGKLRWSETLELHNDFIVVAPRRRSRLAFSLYWQLSSTRRGRPARAERPAQQPAGG
jgi:CelD/BcsL family acetyltransferase involved in cellulose biosynthesis